MSRQSLLVATAVLFTLALALPAPPARAQAFRPSYDESKVPEYTLPDPLVLSSGERVRSASEWFAKRRPEILRLFEREVYGRAPARPGGMRFDVTSVDRSALGGRAIRKLVTIRLAPERADAPAIELLLYVPATAHGPVPAFCALNFQGNHSITTDPGVPLSRSWMRERSGSGVEDHRATEASRGRSASRWPIERILERGYALATAYYGDIDPDFDDGFQNGVHPLFYREGQTKPAPDEWGSIAAWAWGLGRMLDYLELDPLVDASRVAVMGHSRLGKTALWAGASDPRFAMVISNDSGCGGAALSRRAFGETVGRINASFPHWFAANFKKYNRDEAALPVDQHELIALVAPRPVYVASAAEDRWADPRGEFLSALGADPVYRLLGTEGLPVKEMPRVDHPVAGRIGYHIRSGGHDVKRFDWERYLDFADRHLREEVH